MDVEQEGDGAAELSSGEAGEGALLASELLSEAEEDALLAAVVGGPTEADLEEMASAIELLLSLLLRLPPMPDSGVGRSLSRLCV